jgi:hypothetical protein
MEDLHARKSSPSRLWNYGLIYIAEVQSLLASSSDNHPGIEKNMGQTVDISG